MNGRDPPGGTGWVPAARDRHEAYLPSPIPVTIKDQPAHVCDDRSTLGQEQAEDQADFRVGTLLQVEDLPALDPAAQ
jgi:hypothetical protein